MKITTILQTGIIVEHNRQGNIKVTSPFLMDEPIYNEPTVDTMLRNQLKDQLIKLNS